MHPDIFKLVGLDGCDELRAIPLRQFRALWLNASSLVEGSSLTTPPTPVNPSHKFVTMAEYELMAKYCRNFTVSISSLN